MEILRAKRKIMATVSAKVYEDYYSFGYDLIQL